MYECFFRHTSVRARGQSLSNSVRESGAFFGGSLARRWVFGYEFRKFDMKGNDRRICYIDRRVGIRFFLYVLNEKSSRSFYLFFCSFLLTMKNIFLFDIIKIFSDEKNIFT